MSDKEETEEDKGDLNLMALREVYTNGEPEIGEIDLGGGNKLGYVDLTPAEVAGCKSQEDLARLMQEKLKNKFPGYEVKILPGVAEDLRRTQETPPKPEWAGDECFEPPSGSD